MSAGVLHLGRVTVDDLRELTQEDDGSRYEIIDGRLRVIPVTIDADRLARG